MEAFIDAVKNNDLIAAKKVIEEGMKARTLKLIEDEKIAIAKSIFVEGEEPGDADEDDIEDDDDDGTEEDE
ncbi:prohead core protein [Providencia phage PSTCR6]|nr:prohead core protein [Providencia phage PSTCR6]